MKKITLFIAACTMAFMVHAAGGTLTYELNGGVTNSHGWTNKNDMYMGLNASFNTFKGTSVTWISLDSLIKREGSAILAVPMGIPTQAGSGVNLMDVPFIADATVKAEWQWLIDYMDAACVAQTKALATSSGATLRYNLSSFFFSSVRVGWPASPDYAVLGQPEAFMPAWKHAFAGPATYDGATAVTIPTPYKLGFTFDGWYENAAFTGAKVTVLPIGTTGNKTLYAKWIEYIPTCKEVVTGGAGKTTKAGGVVTYISGTTAYIQDASGGLKIEFTSAPSIAIGDKITLSGNTVGLGSYIEVSGATLSTKETATLPTIQTVILPTLNTDAAAYMFEYVYLEGLNILSYGSGNVVVLGDDVNNTIELHAALNPAQLPVNTKINVKAVVSYDGKVILVGDAGKVTVAPVPRPDTFVYPTIESNKYTLTSKWLVSNNMDNYSANPLGTSGFVRGMIAKGGKMYFPDREHQQLIVIDGATGKKLAPLKTDTANLFKHAGIKVGYPFNDIKLDGAGNVLVANLITSNVGAFQVWNLDLATGKGTVVIDEVLKDNPDFSESTIRFDAFGVYGDVTKNAIIMAANASAMEVYKWTITDGVAGNAEAFNISTSDAGTYLTGLTNPGSAPQIFPMDEDYFYLDGNVTLPTLIDMQGNIVDGFYNVPVDVEDWGSTPDKRQGHNGLVEFDVAGEHFLIIAATNTAGVPPSSFRLFKWADGNKAFSAIKSLWTIPNAGMGAASNAYRSAIPSVEVNNTTNTATIYLYTGENGYGVYDFKVNNQSGLIANQDNNAVSVFVNNRTLTLNKEVASVAVYSVAGQLVAKATNTSSINVLSNGVFMVRAITLDGKTAVHKVIVQ